MSERPILFSGPMVRAILDGRKTQTRRIVTHRHGISFLGGAGQEDDPECWGWSFDGPDHSGYMVLERGLNQRHDHGLVSMPCPYGNPGDRMWVRETWCFANPEYPFVGSDRPVSQRGDRCYYRATDGELERDDGGSPWRPSIHMPRWASRICLRVTDVRVQRLQEISEEDAKAEGARHFPDLPTKGEHDPARWSMAEPSSTWECMHSPRYAFGNYWDSINAKRTPWADNPWVWAISFERLP